MGDTRFGVMSVKDPTDDQTIWHEMEHVMQMQREGYVQHSLNYGQQMSAVGYWNNSYEVAARYYSDALWQKVMGIW